MIFVLPLFFGIAHIHHAYELYSLHKNDKSIIPQIIFSIGNTFIYHIIQIILIVKIQTY